jgi:hypothetical protein
LFARADGQPVGDNDGAVSGSSAQIALANTMNSPARAKITRSTGLMARARFWFTEPSEMAWTRSAGRDRAVGRTGLVRVLGHPEANRHTGQRPFDGGLVYHSIT